MDLPEREPLPRYVAPLPEWLEDLALRYAWLIVAINLVGTAFGFWFYAVETGQLMREPLVMWPWVPDSPMATLLFAASLAAWKLGRPQEWLNAMAFFGCIILGLWTPYVLLAFREFYTGTHPLMYQWLFWSHLAMVAQAFVIHRYSEFPPWAVGVAILWYGFDFIVDFLVPIVGEPHHTVLPTARNTPMWGNSTAIDVAAAGAFAFTVLALSLALTTRVWKLERKISDSRSGR